MWREVKMPELQLKTPWYGYPLDLWTTDDDALAMRLWPAALFSFGEEIKKGRCLGGERDTITKPGCAKKAFQSSRGMGWKTLQNCRESPGREPAGGVLMFSSRAWKDLPACYVGEIPAGGSLNIERHLYEKIIYIIHGFGATEVWSGNNEKRKSS